MEFERITAEAVETGMVVSFDGDPFGLVTRIDRYSHDGWTWLFMTNPIGDHWARAANHESVLVKR